MKKIFLAIKGFIMGIANIIPGVSGGTIALILGIYEKLINILSAFWKNFIENLKFLLPLLIGLVIALIGGSFVIDWSLEKFPIATTMLFIGFVIGGIPFIFKKVHKKANVINIVIFVIVAAFVVFMSLLSKGKDVTFEKIDFLTIIKLIGVGAIAAITMIIPGISGSLTLMSLGYYESIIGAIKELFSFTNIGHNLLILFPFGIGVLIGLILIARLIKFLLNRFPIQSYFAILAFVLASIFAIIIQIDVDKINIIEFIVGVILMIGGSIGTLFLSIYDEKQKKDEKKEETVLSN